MVSNREEDFMRPTLSHALATPSTRLERREQGRPGGWSALGRFAIAALLIPVALATACDSEPRERNLRPTIEVAEGFDAEVTAFVWPEEPSHVVALEIAGRGTVRLGLYEQVAPKTVQHFVACAVRGVYDDTLFHRVINGFMIQGGDPATRKRGPDSTRGDWGDLSVEDEFRSIHHDRGVVSLANRGRPNSGESQFFIVQQASRHLDGKHAIFGRVLEGMEVVDAIAAVETDRHGRWGEKDKPLENVIVTRALLERGSLARSEAAGEPEPKAADGEKGA